MSLADQSQEWFPTSVQVTVHQARNLRVKGKNDTNDSYAIIQVAKEKFSTSVAEKCVDPVWKEEASFDLPLFHPGNADRCTLYIIIMHRAHVGLDKFLGQAVVNLLNLHDNKARKKTDWFKLVDKSGKEDKPRGEVLLDIQFLRNNMSASMCDLSMQDKPRSRISKLKDKVRGRKKDGFSDSASAIVPPVTPVLTDSDPEPDTQSLNQTGVKKKSKLKTLFKPKSNLERNISKSMSTLGTLPEKNSSLSGSRSSGLNVESPQVKNKFKLLGHKRTGSSDSKVSLGALALLGRSNKGNNDQNSLCVNGSHVYAEEAESKSGSSLSLNSSCQGSVEDVPKMTVNADPSRTIPTIRIESDSPIMEQQRHQEEEEIRQANERSMAEAKRLEEEEKYRAEARRLQEEEDRRYQEEQEMRRRFIEDEARRKKQREEEEKERKEQEEQRRKLEAAELQRFEEERRKAEEQKRHEETSMSDRLTSLFGMIRKKDEKKEEEVHKATKEAAPHTEADDRGQLISQHASIPFEDIPLNSDAPASAAEPQMSSLNPAATHFLSRPAKVSAVKPRLAKSLESEPPDCQTPSQLCPFPATSESPFSSVPSESPDTFSTLHSALAPPDLSASPPGSPENLSSVESSPTMADRKKRAPMLKISNPAYVEENGLEQDKRMSLPLPDYDTLFPQKRHGVQGQMQWDHIIAEVNQKHRDSPPEFLSQEMSVDGPVPDRPGLRSSLPQENPALRNNQESKPVPPKKAAPPAPLKAPRLESTQKHSLNNDQQSHSSASPPPVSGPAKTDASNKESLSVRSRDGATTVSPPTPAPRPVSISPRDTAMPDDRSLQLTVNKEAPVPRQRTLGADPVEQVNSSTLNVVSDKHMSDSIQPSSSSSLSSTDYRGRQDFAEFDPFPSAGLISDDPWGHVKQNQQAGGLFSDGIQKWQKLENQGMTAEDFDSIFTQERTGNPFTSFSIDSSRNTETGGKEEDPAFQRANSQSLNQALSPTMQQDNWMFKSHLQPIEEAGRATDKQGFSAGGVANGSNTSKLQGDLKTQSLTLGPVPMFSSMTSFEPLEAVKEEPEPQMGDLSGRTRAWVPPSEVQHAAVQNSNGGGLSFTPRRPHPVKPMNSAESQLPASYPAVKEIRVRESAPRKIQAPPSVDSGPYTQLTQEELITMVVRQQTDLTRKNAKITELEEYIDNLLVRVIEEKPTILQALNQTKPM